MTYRIQIDRKRFIELFDRKDDSIFHVPLIVKYDPVVENIRDRDYIYFRFDQTPTEKERTLIELALSGILYTGPAVSDADITSSIELEQLENSSSVWPRC